MAFPESHFIRGLQAFKHRTLVSVCDGDLLVPYASASIQDQNSYPLTSTSKDRAWTWAFGHSGFESIVEEMLEQHTHHGELHHQDDEVHREKDSLKAEYACDERYVCHS